MIETLSSHYFQCRTDQAKALLVSKHLALPTARLHSGLLFLDVLLCYSLFYFVTFLSTLWFQIKLILVKDGSGQGGAFAAASALRQLSAGIRCA